MTSKELRQKYLDFFKARGHQVIPSAPLVPENDPTTLFTSSGMQPLIQYFLGEEHPLGKRLVDSQKCFRAQDIEEVGDNRHTTFFEMLGNWSFGDYFKKEQLTWFFEFLTKELGLDPQKLYVTVFSGDEKLNVPADQESVEIWQELFKKAGTEANAIELGTVEKGSELGMQSGKIFAYGAKKNWWSRSGTPENMPAGEPGGPDSEVFYEFTEVEHDLKFGKHCHPNCDCGRFLEIGNSVFMQYQKQADGSFKELPNKNVDFGGGLERQTAATNNEPDMFKIDLFSQIIKSIEVESGQSYSEEKHKPPMRIIADHIKAATFLIVEGVTPSNKRQGYVLRRLLRRSAVKMYLLTGNLPSTTAFASISTAVLNTYDGIQGINKEAQESLVHQTIADEVNRFNKTLEKGLKEIQKIENINGKIAFDLYQTYGFPLELTEELATEKGQKVDHEEFSKEFEKHKELSRTAAAGMFKGGLGEQSEITTKYHTATHLLHAALRQILGSHVQQKGSNITGERMRFDFSHQDKLTDQQIKKVEDMVNEKIKANLPVNCETMAKEDAINSEALGFFTEKYGDKVTVYTIGDPSTGSGFPFSREICGGPHVDQTGKLGHFQITKEESAGSNLRRIYATLS